MNQILDDIRKDAIKQVKLNSEHGDDKAVYKAIGTMLSLAELAHNKGLLAVCDFLETMDYNIPLVDTFKRIGTLIINGTDPEFVEEIVTNMYWRREFKGYEALVVYIYARGMLMIQQGDCLRVQEDVYHSLLSPIEWINYENSEYKWTKTEKSYKDYRIEFKDDTTQTLVDYVNESFENMSDEQFKQFLNTAHNEFMITVLPYITDKADVRLFDNISDRLKDMLIEDAKFQQYVNEKSLREALLQLIGRIIAAKKIKG